MSAGKGKGRPERAINNALLRQLQQARAVAKCIIVAGDDSDGLDVADAVSGLLIVLEGAIATLDRPGGVP